VVSRYTDEDYERIRAESAEAIRRADAALAGREVDPLDVPVERINDRHRRELAEQDRRFARERRAPRPLTDTEAARHEQRLMDLQQQNVMQAVADAIAAERAYTGELLTQLIVQLRQEHVDALERATTSTAVEIANIRVTLAELRLEVATERTKAATAVLDLPTISLRGSRTN
jgi:hypothetical protein